MTGEIRFGTEIVDSSEEIEGHDFRVPSIKWSGWDYELYGLHLPYEWEKETTRLSEQNPKRYCTQLERLCQGKQLNWELRLDEKTGLITEVKLNNDKQVSRVYLDIRPGRSGIYSGEDIQNLHMAVIYQDFLAHYLSFLTNFKKLYSHIIVVEENRYGSADLTVPREIINFKESITNEYYQRQFELKASNITGQFGTDLRYVKFDEKGLLDIVQIDRNDCNYTLDSGLGSYSPHNVDNIFQAATLHGIAAEFINDLLRRK